MKRLLLALIILTIFLSPIYSAGTRDLQSPTERQLTKTPPTKVRWIVILIHTPIKI